MSGHRPPSERGSPPNDDPEPESALSPRLRRLMVYPESSGLHTNMPPLAPRASSTSDEERPLLSDDRQPTLSREPNPPLRQTLHHFALQSLSEDSAARSQSITPVSDDYDEEQSAHGDPRQARRESCSDHQRGFGDGEHIRPPDPQPYTHPQPPSIPTRLTLPTPQHAPLYLPIPVVAQTYAHPGRSGSTDYFTDSSNASAASSGGRPPQSAVSSGSSHMSVRNEMSAHSQSVQRPESTGLEANVREYGYSAERIRLPTSNARGTPRHVGSVVEGREGNVQRQWPRQHLTRSPSTTSQGGSASPTSGSRTPSFVPPHHQDHATQYQSQTQYLTSEFRFEEPPTVSRPSRSYDYRHQPRTSRRASTVHNVEASTSPSEPSGSTRYPPHRAVSYDVSRSSSLRNIVSRNDSSASTPWHTPEQGSARSGIVGEQFTDAVPHMEHASDTPPSSMYYDSPHAQRLARRSISTSRLRGPGYPGLTYSPPQQTPTPRDYATSSSHSPQMSISAPTPGYASNSSENIAERFLPESPEARPVSLSPIRMSYAREEAHTQARPELNNEARRSTLQPEASTPENRSVQYTFPPEAHSRTVPHFVPGRPSPGEDVSPSSAKRARTNSSPASTFSLGDYMTGLSSSPTTESTPGAGPSTRAGGHSHPSQVAAPPETEVEPAQGTTGKRKKSPSIKSEPGRPRGGKGKRTQRSLGASVQASDPQTLSANVAVLAEELAARQPARQPTDPAPSYQFATHTRTQELSIEPQLLVAQSPERSSTLDAQGEKEPPPSYEEASSSRISLDKGKDSKDEKGMDVATDSAEYQSETNSPRKEECSRKASISKEDTTAEGEKEAPATEEPPKPLFVIGAPPPPQERKGRQKIDVACAFCRARKMRCDGHKPACNNCQRKSHPCVYADTVRRRGPGKKTKQKAIEARPKKTNKRIEESKLEERKKEEAEARRLAELRVREREAREAEQQRLLAEGQSVFASVPSTQQHGSQTGPSQLHFQQSLLDSPPRNVTETTGGLDLFPGRSPLSPTGLSALGGPLSPSAPADLSALRMPDDELPLNSPVPDSMDVGMASPTVLSPTFPAQSSLLLPTEASILPLALSSSELQLHPSSSISRHSRHDLLDLSNQSVRPDHSEDSQMASSSSSASASRSSTRGRTREAVVPHSTSMGAGNTDIGLRLGSSSMDDSSRVHSGISSPQVREYPSTESTQSAFMHRAASSSSRSSDQASFTTIPTPAQLLVASLGQSSTSALAVPSQSTSSERLPGPVTLMNPGQLELIARRALSAARDQAGGSSVSADNSAHLRIQPTAGLSSSVSASAPGAQRLSEYRSGSGSDSVFGSASASSSTGIRELASVSAVPEPRASRTVTSSLVSTGAAAEQSSDDDTNNGKKKRARTKRRQESGDVSASRSSVPRVTFPASEAPASHTTFSFVAPGYMTGSASEALAGSVSARQVETPGREEAGQGHGAFHFAGLPRSAGDDSRVRDNYGRGPVGSSARPLSSAPGIGRRRVREDSFGGYYDEYEAHEGDPFSGERPTKRAKENPEQAARGRSAGSSSALPRRRAEGVQMGEEDAELEDGEIPEPATYPSSSNRPPKPSSSSRGA